MNDSVELNLSSTDNKKTAPVIIHAAELMKFRALFSIMSVIIAKEDHQVLYESDAYIANFTKFGKDTVARVIDNRFGYVKKINFDFSLVYEGIRIDYKVEIKDVLFDEREAYLAIIQEQAQYSASPSTDEKITQISKALLKIVSAVDIGDDISKTLDLILAESIKGFEYGHLGTVFIVQDDVFKNISSIGFADEIKDFKLSITETFLYNATQGKMDRIAIINDIKENYNIKPVRTITGEIFDTNSALVAPIFYKGALYGMMSIDSAKKNAFSQDDLAVMTFIRDNVQVLISNQLTFLERTNQALTDNMTGLYNRHFLIEHFNSILERAKRYNETFCVLVFDLDDLKAINDRYGHLVGDHLIKAFAKTLYNHTRRSDILARFGGDEFVAVILTDKEDEIHKRIKHFDRHLNYTVDGVTLVDTNYDFSYGLAVYPKDGSNYAELINKADARMYKIKTEKKEKKE